MSEPCTSEFLIQVSRSREYEKQPGRVPSRDTMFDEKEKTEEDASCERGRDTVCSEGESRQCNLVVRFQENRGGGTSPAFGKAANMQSTFRERESQVYDEYHLLCS